MKFFSLENKLLIWAIFILLFIYLILRAVFLTPYCDELSTLFEYIEAPYLIETTVKESSANNHLLNTLLGKFAYLFFGDTIYFLRIPNILSFILYFFSIKYIVSKCILYKYQFLTFIALNTVAWIFEYFGYLRGYGLALGLLFYAISIFHSWSENKKPIKFFFFLFLVWLSVFANLSFFNTSIILLFYSIMYLVLNFSCFKNRTLIIYFLIVISFVLALYPLVLYSFELKEAGALWWGNLDGLWMCTGNSLSQITLFTTHISVKYFALLVIVLIGIGGLLKLKSIGFKEFISSFEGIFYTLFIGNIFMIEILAVFFKVNYPKDRAAVQLVLFLIFAFVLFIQKIRFLNYLSFVLLFFPISFLLKINVKTSIYQNDHRLSNSVDQYLEKHLSPESSYSLCGLLETSGYLRLRNEKKMKLFNIERYSKYIESSFLIIESNNVIPSFYNRKMVDTNSEITIYENTKKYKYNLVKDTVIKFSENENDIMLFQQKGIDSIFKSNKFKVKITSLIKFSDQNIPLHLILTLGDSLNPIRHYHENSLEKLAKRKNAIDIVWNSPVYTIEKDKKNMSIYMWNINKKLVQYRNLNLKIYSVEESKH
jgi:hypothetical protein